MKLISCSNCGVVLDAGKLEFPEDIRDNNNEVISDRAILDGREWVAKVACPVCKSAIKRPFDR